MPSSTPVFVPSSIGVVISSVFAAAFALLCYFWHRKLSRLPHRVVGEDVPAELKKAAGLGRGNWIVFDRLSKVYGECSIFSFSLQGRPVVGAFINTPKLAWELLEKRGEIYSSRPRLVIAHEILSGGLRGITSQYNDHWRAWRRVQHIGMNGRQALEYREHQQLESVILLRDLAHTPEQSHDHLVRFASSVVLSISYGRRVKSTDDPAVTYNMRTVQSTPTLYVCVLPGKHLVDSWPILLRLPRPLQWFRHEYDKNFSEDVEFYLSMLKSVRERMAAGKQKESMASRAIASGEAQVPERQLAYYVAAPFGAGVHTTVATIEYAIMAALLFPEAAKKAQAELDHVVGRGRLPTFADQSSLPYLGAWIKEVQRWQPIAPLAIPHATCREDDFDVFRIPKGSTVLANIYTMMHDPDMFPDSNVFCPERFLPGEDGTQDSRFRDFTLPFGFGRRMCSGIHVASQSFFIVLARLVFLWAFNTTPAADAPLPDPSAEIAGGLVRAPAPFQFALQPRFQEVSNILSLEAMEADIRLQEWE
ncbi:cytochrome P450 [Vararia minispora EC-137]|uniref:Cytochrome P450 n=1 Tax=Vararia minispora EC-137 TaxID=1314806 RepID=A0ACB8Q8N7_9AGAM|nr:cytochrome P450 [Vararia minispora EC-137]